MRASTPCESGYTGGRRGGGRWGGIVVGGRLSPLAVGVFLQYFLVERPAVRDTRGSPCAEIPQDPPAGA